MRATSSSSFVNHEVGVAADAQISLLRKAECPGRSGRHGDGNFVQRVFAIDLRQGDLAFDRVRQFLDALLANIRTHQQLDDLRIPPETAAVRMIGREKHLPRICESSSSSSNPAAHCTALTRLLGRYV